MSAGFTPGPWAVESEPYVHIRAKDGSQDGWGSTVYAADYPPKDADARLIAAAPELYEAVRLFVEDYDARDDHDGAALMIAYNEALEAGKAALAKARGEA